MPSFNFLSGSSIDNVTSFLYDALKSGEAYLGFAKGAPQVQWGVSALVAIEHRNVPASGHWSDTIVSKSHSASGIPTTDTASTNKFFDVNSLAEIPSATTDKRNIFIGVAPNTDTSLASIDYLSVGALKLTYIGEHWALIEGLDRHYFNLMQPSDTDSYYILNYNKNKPIAMKILSKEFINVPFYTQNCNLFMKATSADPGTLIKSGLERTINILGETYVSGLNSPDENGINIGDQDIILSEFVSGQIHKEAMIDAHSFILKDNSGNILIDNMKFVDPMAGDAAKMYTEISSYGISQKYLTFQYPYIGSDLQYIKFIVGSKQHNDLAIWNEILPYDAVIPTADGNPPGMDVSYLKNPLFSKSIFDVKGMVQILPEDVEFVKELMNVYEVNQYTGVNGYGFTLDTIDLTGNWTEHIGVVKNFVNASAGLGVTTIPLNDFHTFIVGDTIRIPFDLLDPSGAAPATPYTVVAVDYTYNNASITINTELLTALPANYILNSTPSDITARISFAKTSIRDKALKYGLSSALISKIVPLTGPESPTKDIYRQLFICHRPKDASGVACTSAVYGNNFNKNLHEYNVGNVMYLSNKIPIYRKYANIDENFKIVL